MSSSSSCQYGDMKRRLFSPCAVVTSCRTPHTAVKLLEAWQKNPSISFVTVLMEQATRFALLILFIWAITPVAMANEVKGFVQVVDLQGAAEVRIGDDPAWQSVKQGQRLAPGSTLRTRPHSRMALLLADRTQVRLNENSLLEIQEVSDGSKTAGQTKFRQLLGRSWVQSKTVPKGVKWVTPVAVAGLRGTDWEIEVAEDGRTLLTVLSGEIDFSNEFGAMVVKANEQASVEPGKPPLKLLVQNPRQRVQWVSAYQADPLRHITLDGRGIPALRATLAESPSDEPNALLVRARALADLGRWQEARSAFDKALASAPDRSDARTGMAFAALNAGDTERARSLLGATVLDDTRDELAAYAGVSLKILEQDIAGALADLQVLTTRTDLSQPAPWLMQADLMAYAGRFDAGLDNLDLGLQRFPNHPRLLSLKARLQLLADQPALAIASAEAAALADANSFEAQLARGDIARREGDVVNTYDAYERAIALKPEDDRAWFGRGVAESEREFVRAARNDLLRALALRPEGAGYQGERGTLEPFATNLPEAEAAFQMALKTHASDFTALTGLGLLKLKQGEPAAALDAFLRAGVMEPRYARAQVYAAAAYYQLGYHRQALEVLARASEIDPLDPLPHLLSGVIHSDLLRPADAIAASREALRLMPYLKSLNQVANDQKGSANLGQAFALFGMEEWANSYAQDSFNPFWAGSHLFLADRYSGLFSKNSELFQGLLADPTAFGASNRFQSLIPAPASNLSLSLRHSQSDAFDGFSPQIELSGYRVEPKPIAYYLGYENIHFANDDGPYDLGIATAAVGVKPSHETGVFLFLDRGRQTDEAVVGEYAGMPYDLDDELISRRADLGFHYSLNPRSRIWIKAGVFSSDEATVGSLLEDAVTSRVSVQQPEYAFRHSVEVADRHLLSWGADFSLRKTHSRLNVEYTFLPGLGEIGDAHLRERTSDFYLSDTFQFSSDMSLQLDLFYQRQQREAEIEISTQFQGETYPDSDSAEQQKHRQISPRLGLVYRLGENRRLRLAYQNWLRPAGFSSLGPVATAGIPLDDRMVQRGGELNRLRGQVDWEITPRTFATGFVDYKRIDNHPLSIVPFTVAELESLGKLRPRDLGSLMREDLIESVDAPVFERGKVQAAGGAVNLMLNSNWSLIGRYTYADSRNTGTAYADLALPYLPQHTLALGTTWVRSSGWNLSSLLVHRSDRYRDEANSVLLESGFSGAFDLFWQSADKHWLLRFSADDLFDKNLDSQYTAEINFRF